jgi:Cu+-exporting ATPase
MQAQEKDATVHDHGDHEQLARETVSGPVVDPVCGMKIDPANAKYHTERAGTTYYFCSGNCQGKFLDDPNKYLVPRGLAATPGGAKGVIYTCPMHPQIRQIGRIEAALNALLTAQRSGNGGDDSDGRKPH